jgi:hypothetical protein
MGTFVAFENIWFGQEIVKIWPSKVEGVIEKKKTPWPIIPYLGLQAIVSLSTKTQILTHVQHPFYQYNIDRPIPKRCIWKKLSFSFNGQDAKMYMGFKIYGNIKHGAH